MQASAVLFALAYFLMILGVIGAILPVMPGPVLIWVGALLWGWVNGFQAVKWPTFVVLGILMVLALSSDLLLTTVGSRRAGASWKAVVGATAGGLVGAVLFGSTLPIVGSVLGTILGAVIGIMVVEYYDKRDWGQVLQASTGYILGSVAARVLELCLSLLMIAVFAWQVLT